PGGGGGGCQACSQAPHPNPPPFRGREREAALSLPPPERGRSARVASRVGVWSPARMNTRVGEAQFVDSRCDHLQHTVEIFGNVGIPKAEDGNSSFAEPSVARAIAQLALGVLPTIQLDRKS